MKTRNLRVDTPLIHGKYETTTEFSLSDIFRYNAVPSGVHVRIKSVTFRSLNQFGDLSVYALGRHYYAMFRSNVMDASVTSDGHVLSMFQPVTFDETAGVTSAFAEIWNFQSELPDGVTVVISYSYYA